MGESLSAGAWSQPRIRHPAIFIRLRGPRKAILTPANAGVQRGEGPRTADAFPGPRHGNQPALVVRNRVAQISSA